MHQVQGFQIFPQLSINHVIAAFEPRKGGHVVAGRGSSAGRIVKVDQDVVIGDQLVQRRQDVPIVCDDRKDGAKLALIFKLNAANHSHEQVIHDVTVVTTRSIRQVAGGERYDGWSSA
jgi:hypothetical protein